MNIYLLKLEFKTKAATIFFISVFSVMWPGSNRRHKDFPYANKRNWPVCFRPNPPNTTYKFLLASPPDWALVVDLPYSNGYAGCVLAYQNKIYWGLASIAGVGVFSYDPATNVASTSPIITTQGDD